MCVGVFMQIFVFVFLCKRKGAIEGRGKNGREARDGEEGGKGRKGLPFISVHYCCLYLVLMSLYFVI